jgi:hypothetical protein
MISSARPSLARPPSFWMTVACIWVSGWVSSFVVSTFLAGRFGGTGILALVYLSFAAAPIGAFVLRAALPRFADATISYPWAVFALGLGSLAGNSFAYELQTFTLGHARAVIAPVIWSDPLLGWAAFAVSLIVSYQVIAFATTRPSPRTARRVSSVGSTRVAADADDWYDVSSASLLAAASPTGASLDDVVARTDQAVARACIDISRSTGGQVAGHVIDALGELGTCAQSLQHSTVADPKVRAEVERLIDGLNRFQTALTQIATEAAATGSQHLYQGAWLSGWVSDVSDGGSLARHELDDADGLATIRESFEHLRQLGVLREAS